MWFVELLRLLYPILEKNKTGQAEVKNKSRYFSANLQIPAFSCSEKIYFLRLAFSSPYPYFLSADLRKNATNKERMAIPVKIHIGRV